MKALRTPLTLASLPALLFTGCINTTHEVKTVHEIKPIHITVDVNLRVDRELNDFFGDLDKQSRLIDYQEPAADPAHSSTQ